MLQSKLLQVLRDNTFFGKQYLKRNKGLLCMNESFIVIFEILNNFFNFKKVFEINL